MNELNIVYPQVQPLWEKDKMMCAVEWATKGVKLVQHHIPRITEPGDALIRITATAICGSDLKLYHGDISEMKDGDILGHEFMGYIQEIGHDVKNFKVGDRVVVSSIIACGECFYCKNYLHCSCDRTNPSDTMEKIFGHKTAGIFGYSNLTGGFPGGQAEYCRVPYADFNLLKIPDEIKDEQALLLSDALCTAWHANEIGEVGEGKSVVIWGLGPVGLLTAAWAKFRGASKVIGVDNVKNRLSLAVEKIGCEVINFSEKDVKQTLKNLLPFGPDVCFDAAGFSSDSILHKVERVFGFGSDHASVLNDIILSVRKNGTVVVIGDYFSHLNSFPIGPFIGKGIIMKGCQVQVQRYWQKVLDMMVAGEIDFDPSFVVTHVLALDKAEEAYKLLDKKDEGVIKIILKPSIKG